jgi:hypothetical protein
MVDHYSQVVAKCLGNRPGRRQIDPAASHMTDLTSCLNEALQPIDGEGLGCGLKREDCVRSTTPTKVTKLGFTCRIYGRDPLRLGSAGRSQFTSQAIPN